MQPTKAPTENIESPKEKKKGVPKKGEMKYDFAPRNEGEWRSLKLAFFASESQNLTEFIVDLYGQTNGKTWAKAGNFLRKTTGWVKERSEYMDRIEREALDKARKKAVAEAEIDFADLLRTKKAAVELGKIALSFYQKSSFGIDPKTKEKIIIASPNMKDVERVYKMTKTEL